MMRMLFVVCCLALSIDAFAQTATFPTPVEGDFVARDYVFTSGERLPDVRIHYRTVGTPRKDADGVVRNGVLILHGTGGSGAGFLSATYGGRLFGKGQPLDAEKYFIILPDNVGHGQSSKPSDGLRMKFPKYRYTDMVRLQHALVTKGLGLDESEAGDGHVDGRDARVELGLHVSRVRGGPGAAGEQPGGDRRTESRVAQVPDRRDRDRSDVAARQLYGTAARPRERDWLPADGDQHAAAVAEAVPDDCGHRQWVADQVASRTKNTDANDMLYHYHAIEDYNPAPHLAKITAPLLAINSADDFVNPPELPMMQDLVKQVKHGRFILLPITDATRGHGTHSLPAIWGGELVKFMAELK